MFRRIEFIDEDPPLAPLKRGLMGAASERVLDAWFDHLKGPPCRGRLPRNCRFYFTEEGWREVGSRVREAAMRDHLAFRVLRVKEASVEVMWRDRYEVAVRPRKSRYSRKRANHTDQD